MGQEIKLTIGEDDKEGGIIFRFFVAIIRWFFYLMVAAALGVIAIVFLENRQLGLYPSEIIGTPDGQPSEGQIEEMMR